MKTREQTHQGPWGLGLGGFVLWFGEFLLKSIVRESLLVQQVFDQSNCFVLIGWNRRTKVLFISTAPQRLEAVVLRSHCSHGARASGPCCLHRDLIEHWGPAHAISHMPGQRPALLVGMDIVTNT